MKSLNQNYSSGKITIADIPMPKIGDSEVLIKNINSAVSLGTEGSLVKLAKKNILEKALERPDLVRRVFQKLKQTDLKETTTMVLNRLDSPINLGYSASGIIHEIGKNVRFLKKGDLVAYIGAGTATHSEFNAAHEDKCTLLSSDILKEGSMGMLGCIAMHSIRHFRFNLEKSKVVVLGSGLLGNIASQILKAYGAEVVAFDPSEHKTKIINELDIKGFNNKESFESFIKSSPQKPDGVLIACAVDHNGPLIEAVDYVKNDGEIVIMGVVDIKVDRNLLWEKQASIVVSKAGGFEEVSKKNSAITNQYEKKWTEQMNLKEFISLASERRINLKKIITSEISFHDSVEIYEELSASKRTNDLGIIFSYSESAAKIDKDYELEEKHVPSKNIINVIGAGNHAISSFLPILQNFKNEATLNILVTKTPIKSKHYSKKFKFLKSSCNKDDALLDDSTHIISLERHSQHYETLSKCIKNKKNLLIEKPLVSSTTEINLIKELISNEKNIPIIMVGHNRKYSPSVEFLKKEITPNSKFILNMVVNAGNIDQSHWLYSRIEGGNRVIAECSHFIDLFKFITDSKIKSFDISSLSTDSHLDFENFSASFVHNNGCVTNLIYSSLGSRSQSRERIEIFNNEKNLVLTDYKKVEVLGKTKKTKGFQYDLGFKNQINAFLTADQKKNQMQLDNEIDTMKIVLEMSERLQS